MRGCRTDRRTRAAQGGVDRLAGYADIGAAIGDGSREEPAARDHAGGSGMSREKHCAERIDGEFQLQSHAHFIVYKAKRRGILTPPKSCELCGNATQRIVAHHWRGYRYVLDVWWLCRTCNACLLIHDGSLTKAQAYEYVIQRKAHR